MAGTTRLTLTLLAAALAALVLLPAAASATTIPVTSTADNFTDDQLCTLREAVQAANTNAVVNSPGGNDCPAGQAGVQDVVQLGNGTFSLAISNVGSDDTNQEGDIDVNVTSLSGDMQIAGAGSGNTTINAMDIDRAIHVIGDAANSDFILTGATVTNGTAPASESGGALQSTNGANVTLLGAAVTASVAPVGGGGINFATGTLSLNNSTVSGNSIPASGVGDIGGGIHQQAGTLNVTDSTISTNTVSAPSPGLGANVSGGGVSAFNLTAMNISRSTISGNQVLGAAGNVNDFPSGGGVSSRETTTTITDSTFSGNVSTGGNTADAAGLAFEDQTGAANNTLTIQNSTFSGNNADDPGGAISIFGGITTITNATFSLNNATSGDALEGQKPGPQTGASLSVRGTLFDEGASACVFPSLAATSTGYNIDEGTTCNLATGTDQQNIPITIGVLANNGGPTLTHALGSGANGHDDIPQADCDEADGDPLTTDQRGVPRPSSSNLCDIGAYERTECGSVLVTIVGSGGDDTLTGTAGADGIMALGGGDTIDPGDGADCVLPGTGDDTIVANADSDNDQITDGGGSDTLTLANEGNVDGRTLSVGSGFGTTSGPGFGGDLFSDIENAIGSPGDDTLMGDEVVNVLDGGDGDDTLNGGTADDTLTGGEGGETNGDTISFSGAAVAIIFDLAAGSPQNAGQGNDAFSGMENVLGGSAGDALRGDGTNNIINGGFGAINDTLEGRAGDDTLDGGTGPGAGTADGAGDTVVYDEAASGVTVDISFASAQNTIGDGMDTILDTESVTGSAHNDVLTGSAVANQLSGLNGNDRASFNNGGAGVIANLATDSATGQGTDQLPNIENLEGSANADTLTGDDNVNFLLGQGGGDTLTGAGGSDLVHGNGGGDNIFIRDGVMDTADCGPDLDADTVEADLMGTDTLTTCDGTDTISFALPVTPVTPVTPTTPTTTKKKCPKGKKLKKVKGKKKCVKKKKKRR